jgi:hypothetical protein
VRIPFVAVSAAVLLAACASTEPPPVEMKPTGVPGKAIGARSTKLTATVKAIDAAKRTITIADPDGKAETIKVRPEVKRFDELAVGDRIVVEVNQGLLLEYQPPGSPALQPAAGVAGGVADKAQPPAAAVAGVIQSTVTVVDVSTFHRTVTFQDPDGNKYTVKAAEGIAIEKLKVGDRLAATYVETVAIGIEKPAANQ